jgi:uncharacterized protein (DUF1501 family)
MKRRSFIKAAPAVVLPALVGGYSIKAYGASPLVSALAGADADNDHVLVLIQLDGGNDGLNTVIPLDQYSTLSTLRNNVLIAQNKVLPLNGTTATGLHPSMTGIQQLYNDNKVRIVQGVSYPNPNFSHFRATDIWTSAADSNQTLTTGWIGRYLNYEYPNFPTGYPNTDAPHPLAVQIGSFISPIFQGPTANYAMAISDPVNFYNLVNGIQDPAPATPAGDELTYVRLIANQANQYATIVKDAANTVTSQGTYPSNNSLADQLKIVARLIGGGLKTRVYMVRLGGFDTHATQVVPGTTDTGTHADLLGKLSSAIKAFQDDIQGLGVADRVVGLTFSEFGRRIISNFSSGTDHGAAAPCILFGNKVIPGILGANPNISASTGVNDNLPMQYDFRSIYTSLLQDWFCVPKTVVDASITLQNFQLLPLVNPSGCYPASVHDLNSKAGIQLIKSYPNPFVEKAKIEFTTGGGHTLIEVYDGAGKHIKTLIDQDLTAGNYVVDFRSEDALPGLYYARLQNGVMSQVVGMSLVR